MSTTTIAPPSGAPTPPPAGGPPAWHTLDPDAALAAQAVDSSTGLSAAEVRTASSSSDRTRSRRHKKESAAQRWLRQYQDPMQIVLVVAGVDDDHCAAAVGHGPRAARLDAAQRGDGPAPGRQGRGERLGAAEDADRQDARAARRPGRAVAGPGAGAGRHRAHRGRRSRARPTAAC